MTQIAFHRKLMDRNLKVVGSGSRATVGDMSIIPRAVSLDIDWSTIARHGR